MPNGFEGVEINKGNLQVINPNFGFLGVEMVNKTQLYLTPSFGFIGIEFNLTSFEQPASLKIVKK